MKLNELVIKDAGTSIIPASGDKLFVVETQIKDKVYTAKGASFDHARLILIEWFKNQIRKAKQ